MPVTEEIRAADQSDFEAVKVLLQECFPNRKVVVPEVQCLVAADNEVIIGCTFYRIAADECEIIDICVKPENRRGGLASKLLAEVFRRAKEAGAEKFFLEVENQNEAAISLYRKQGFEESGLRKRYYRHLDGTEADALVMTKAL